jgi:hypothetical protein
MMGGGQMDDEQRAAFIEGIRQGVFDAMPLREEVLAAIQEGVRLAFDQLYGSEIANAIADGTKEAFEARKR